MKAIITCGGTGGHITPALAIADILRANITGCEILFVGTEGGMEQSLVTNAGYPIRALRVAGVSRKNPFALLHTLHLAHGAVREAKTWIDVLQPDIVIGTGSYACYPTLAAAVARGVPAAVHESNAVPGLAVRVLARRLSRVWLGFEAARAHLPNGTPCLTVGNPLPRGFCAATGGEVRGAQKIVLSFGGSLGAPAINAAVLELMEKTRDRKDIRYVHATGKREWERFSRALAARGLDGDLRYEIHPFLADMPRRMREATVVICRAGAMSISEVAMAGRAAVLVPSPNVTGDHQRKNAETLAKAGAAVLLEEGALGQKLAPTVLGLLESEAERASLSSAVRHFAHPEANRLIFEDVLRLVQRK